MKLVVAVFFTCFDCDCVCGNVGRFGFEALLEKVGEWPLLERTVAVVLILLDKE